MWTRLAALFHSFLSELAHTNHDEEALTFRSSMPAGTALWNFSMPAFPCALSFPLTKFFQNTKIPQTLMFTVIRYFEQIGIYQPTTLCDSIGFPNTLKHQIYALGCLRYSERYRQQFRSKLRGLNPHQVVPCILLAQQVHPSMPHKHIINNPYPFPWIK